MRASLSLRHARRAWASSTSKEILMLEAFTLMAVASLVGVVGYVAVKCVAHAVDTVVELVL